MTKAKTNDYVKARRNSHIAELALQAMPTNDIGKEVGLSGSRVRGILASDERCRQILDDVHRVNILRAKGINRQLLKLCYHQDPKIQLDAIKHHNKITRISPTHTSGNTIFTQIYNDNRDVPAEQVPRISELFQLREQADLAEEAEIIESEPDDRHPKAG